MPWKCVLLGGPDGSQQRHHQPAFAGAGRHGSNCDWANMLLRMYQRFAEKLGL